MNKNEETIRALLETAAQAILTVDADGRIELVNATAEQMFGYSRKEMLGHPVEMLIPMRLRVSISITARTISFTRAGGRWE